MKTHAIAAAALTALTALTLSAQAQVVDKTLNAPQSLVATQAATWTAEDYARAKPLLPRARNLGPNAFDFNTAVAEGQRAPQADVQGHRGGAEASHLMEVRRMLPRLAQTEDALANDGLVQPDAVGTNGIPFTSSRASSSAAQDKTFPMRTIGKLYFKDAAGGSFMCSGSMIKPGVVLTAGHCVHSGNGLSSGWYNSFQFIPAMRRSGTTETRPYGTWTSWAQARTSTDWFSGGGGVPNLRDWALIVFNADSAGKRIGDYTGWLGYQYPSLIGKHMSVLGYPANLDSGTILHRTDSNVTDNGSNNGIWGSDMRGGSSGGPAVLNFQYSYTGGSASTLDNSGNRATGVVSWGYISEAPQVQGASQFDSVFGTMLTSTCSAFPSLC